MDKQRKIQTQLIIARIYLSEKAKKSILSSVSVDDISAWTGFSKEAIQEEISVCEEFDIPKLCEEISVQYVQKAYRDYREKKNIETWFFGMYRLYGIRYSFSKEEHDLKQWIEESLPRLGTSLIIDINGLPEGTLTVTVLRNSMDFFRHSLLEKVNRYSLLGYDPEVLAYILGIPPESLS